jgi:hypothetical protein
VTVFPGRQEEGGEERHDAKKPSSREEEDDGQDCNMISVNSTGRPDQVSRP